MSWSVEFSELRKRSRRQWCAYLPSATTVRTSVAASAGVCCGRYANRVARSWARSFVIGAPRSSTCPELGITMPAIARSKEHFPVPLEPMMPWTSPARIARFAPLTTMPLLKPVPAGPWKSPGGLCWGRPGKLESQRAGLEVFVFEYAEEKLYRQ